MLRRQVLPRPAHRQAVPPARQGARPVRREAPRRSSTPRRNADQTASCSGDPLDLSPAAAHDLGAVPILAGVTACELMPLGLGFIFAPALKCFLPARWLVCGGRRESLQAYL